MKRFKLFALLIFLIIPLNSQAKMPLSLLKKMGVMSGQVYIENKPLPDSIVSFFLVKNGPPPVEDGMRRVPEFLSRTDNHGKFNTRLMAGDYYIGILLREPGAGPGPPREGEKFYFASSRQGKLQVFSIREKEILDIGIINGASPGSFTEPADYFTVSGTVKNARGEPFPGIVILGKSQLNIPRPEFISVRTGADGVYTLKLSTSKAYFLVARETIANARPRPGSYIGTYGIMSITGLATPSIFSAGSPPPGVLSHDDGSRAKLVSGSSGEEISNVDIFMYQVPNPEEVKASVQGTPNSPRFDLGTDINIIFFPFNSHKLDPKSFPELDQWVAFLQGRGDLGIELRGHTDNSGNSTFNYRLSKKRADRVAAYFYAKGIPREKIFTTGLGPDQPLATNDSEQGRSRNRRVEIKFIYPENN